MKVKTFDDFLKDDETRKLVNQEMAILEVTEAIIGYMEDNDVTRAQLAERMGKRKSQVTQLLSGSRNLTLRSLADIALALGVEISFNILEIENQPVASIVPKTREARNMDDIGSWKASVEHMACRPDGVRSEKLKKGRKLPLAFND